SWRNESEFLAEDMALAVKRLFIVHLGSHKPEIAASFFSSPDISILPSTIDTAPVNKYFLDSSYGAGTRRSFVRAGSVKPSSGEATHFFALACRNRAAFPLRAYRCSRECRPRPRRGLRFPLLCSPE